MVGKLVALVLPLGFDTFAVAAGLAMIRTNPATRRRISVMFPVFEAGMPLIGLAIGAPLGRAIGSGAEYLAIAVLFGFGLYALSAGDERDEQALARLANARGASSLLLGLTISLDELAIGFTLGLLELPVVLVIALIAAQAVILTQLGLRFGNRLSERFDEGAERAAGLALAGLAVALLAEKLL